MEEGGKKSVDAYGTVLMPSNRAFSCFVDMFKRGTTQAKHASLNKTM